MKDTIIINFNFDWLIDTLIQIWVIINPAYYLMNYSYSKKWNKELNELMSRYEFTDIGECTAKLGDKQIWIENHPYASFTDYTNGRDVEKRPSRLTIYKAMRKLEKDRNKPQPAQPISMNPAREIPLPLMGGLSIASGYTMSFRVERSNNETEQTGEYNNGIPRSWDDGLPD